MSDPVLEKRDNHCFISYASEDGALAQRIAKWLGEAGLRIWFDQVRLGAGAPVLDVLTRQVCNSRAFLLVATEKALTKDCVKHEVDIACEQHITQPRFTIIAVRTNPGLDLSTRFPSLCKVGWMSIRHDQNYFVANRMCSGNASVEYTIDCLGVVSYGQG
jgi:TIR domain